MLALLLELLHVNVIRPALLILDQPSKARGLHLFSPQLGDQLVDLVDELVESLAELGKVDLAVLPGGAEAVANGQWIGKGSSRVHERGSRACALRWRYLVHVVLSKEVHSIQ